MKNVPRIPMSFRSIVSTALSTATALAALLLLDASPARAQTEVIRPFACLTYSLSESLASGSPFLRQAPPPGCAVPASPLPSPLFARALVPAAAPTGLTASVEGHAVSLKWNAASGGVRSYVVSAGTASGIVNLAKFDTESASPTLTVTDVPEGLFYFRVSAESDNGVSADSNEVSARVGVSRFTPRCIYNTPANPTALTVNYLAGNILSFSWRAPEVGDCQALFPAASYVLEYSTTPLAAPKIPVQFFDLVRDLNNTTTLLLPYGSITGTFYVWIRGCGVNGCGPPSNEVTLTLGGGTGVPSAPANVNATGIGNTLVLVWDEVTNPASNRSTGYTITVTPPINGSGRLGSGAPISQGGKPIGLYRTTGIPKGTYTFQVQGTNPNGLGPMSAPVSVTLDGPGGPVRVGTLHSFTGAANDGANLSTLIQGRSDLEWFGTASSGGPVNSRCVQDRNGCGVVFRQEYPPSLTVIGTFGTGAAPGSGNPPTYPRTAPLLASDGFLWGTTIGQEFTNPNGGGAAVVYKVSPTGSGAVTIVAELGGPSFGKVMQARNGLIYGTTQANGPGTCGYRGTNCSPSTGSGTVWSVPTSGGPVTYIHTFTGPDGASPYGGLMQGADGLLYGMTQIGGTFNLGTIYRINPADNSFTKIYDFPGGTGGAYPYLGELMQIGSSSSVFYGVTFCGGDQSNTPTYCGGVGGGKGTIFSMTVSGNTATVNILHRFTGRIQETGENELTQAYDGVLPSANLTDGRDGRLYGVTNGGGPYGAGTAFSIRYDGSGYSQLYAFDGNAAGGLNGTLVYLATYGVFLGVGQYGGGFNYGSIFYMYAPTGY